MLTLMEKKSNMHFHFSADKPLYLLFRLDNHHYLNILTIFIKCADFKIGLKLDFVVANATM